MARTLKKPIRDFLKLLRWLLVLLVLAGVGLTVYGLVEPNGQPGTPILGDYALIKENSRSAYIISRSDGQTVIPSIVISYAVSGDYIAVKRTEVPETADVKPDFTTFTYWLIDSQTNEITGPIATDEEFNAAAGEHSLSFTEWLGT